MLNIQKVILIILSIILNINTLIAQPLEINVSAGSDLIEIRDQVRTMNNEMTSDIHILLEGGRYFLSETLELNEQDSPSNGYRIIWKNKENERPSISGGIEIENWIEKKNGIIAAAVNEGFRFRQLYVNNKKAERAKYLNETGTWARVEYDSQRKSFFLPEDEAVNKGIKEWEQMDKVEINVVSTFVTHQVKLEGVSTVNNMTYLHVAEPAATILNEAKHIEGHEFDVYFENANEFLDMPGEWYLDESVDTVYYKMKSGETLSNIEIIAPKIETLLNIDGANNIVFFGLLFEHNTWLRPSDSSLVSLQNLYKTASGGWPGNYPIPAAIDIQRSENIQFERNIIRYTGGTGIMAWDDQLKNLALIGNVFYKTAAAALQLGNDDKKGLIEPQEGLYRPVVRNNYFYKTGLQYGSPVVFGTFPYQLDFIHNEIVYSNAMGLNLGWGGLVVTDLLYRSIVKYNKFDSICRVGTDAAVFHTRNYTKGSRITENWFDHTIKVFNDRLLGRYTNSINDPKFGNMYLDNDARHNNFIGNVHTNFSSNGYDGGRDGFYVIGARSSPNYIVDYSTTENNYVKANAGLGPAYEDIKTYMSSGSIGGELNPGSQFLASYLVDDRDPALIYSGAWTTEDSGGEDLNGGGYLNTYTSTLNDNDDVTLYFKGEGIEIFGPVSDTEVLIDIFIDNERDTTIQIQGQNQFQKTWYINNELDYGSHSLKIVKTGGDKLIIDGIEVYQTRLPDKISDNSTSTDYILEENYEDIENGSLPLNHIASPSDGGSIVVQDVGDCNNKKLVLSESGYGYFTVPFDESTIIYWQFDLVPRQIDKSIHFDLRDGSTTVSKIAFTDLGDIRVFDGSDATAGLMNYYADSAYRIQIVADYQTMKNQLFVNANDLGTYDFKLSTKSKFNGIRILSFGSSAGEFYFDNMIISDKPVSGPLIPYDDCNPMAGYIKKNKSELCIYPNPSSNIIYVRQPDPANIQKVELFNISGQLILIRDEQLYYSGDILPLNLTNIESGYYILKVHTKETAKSFKILKTN